MKNTAWLFTGNTIHNGLPIPAIGETAVVSHKGEIHDSGYSWSLEPHQALKYAPGPIMNKVSFGGYVEVHYGLGFSSEITIIARIDATKLLRRFAADVALGVSHLWDMPEVVRDYLTTLDETKRVSAAEAAWAAAWASDEAVRVTAEAAAEAAVRAAKASAEADEAAARATRAATRAAEAAALASGATEVAWVAAWAATEVAAWAARAAEAATWAAAWNTAMSEFDRRVYEAFE